MAVEIKHDRDTLRTGSPGTKDYTVTSWSTTPDAMLSVAVVTDGLDGVDSEACMTITLSDGTNAVSVSSASRHNGNGISIECGHVASDDGNARGLRATSPTDTIDFIADVTGDGSGSNPGPISGGWRWDFTDEAHLAWYVSHLFFAGTTNVSVGTATVPGTSASPASISVNLGWEPDMLIIVTTGKAAAFNETINTNTNLSIGVAANQASIEQWALCISQEHQADYTECHEGASTSHCALVFDTDGTASTSPESLAFDHKIKVDSFDSSGFTLSQDTGTQNNTNSIVVGYLAIKGVEAKADVFNALTSGTTQDITFPGWNPLAIMHATQGENANTDSWQLNQGYTLGIGLADGTGTDNQSCLNFASEDNQNKSDAQSSAWDSFSVAERNHGVVEYSADLNSLSTPSTGYQLSYTDLAQYNYRVYSIAFREAAAGGATLSPNNCTHSHSATAASLSQNQKLAAASATSAHSATEATLTVNYQLSVDNGSHAHSATSPTLLLSVGIDPANATSTHTADNATLTQGHYLSVDSATHAHSATAATLSQNHQLAIANSAHAHSAISPTLLVSIGLDVDNASHAHSASAASLLQGHYLAIDNAASAHTATVATLLQNNKLAIDSASHAHAADNASLLTGWAIDAANASHAHSATAATLSQNHYLAIDNAVNAHSSTVATLTYQQNIVIDAASHAHAADNATVTEAAAALSVDSTTHAHTAENATLALAEEIAREYRQPAGPFVLELNVAREYRHPAGTFVIVEAAAVAAELWPADCTHAHSATAAALVTGLALTIDNASHAHAATAASLLQGHYLDTANASHAHTADNVTLTAGLAVAGDAATHAHTATAATLTQNHYLAIDTAVIAHSATSATLLVGGALAPDNATSVHTADVATLTQAHYLSIDGCTHAHTADQAAVTTAGFLQIDSATHAHTATEPALLTGTILEADDATHATSSETATLAQIHSLAIDNTSHAISSETPRVREGRYLAVDGAVHSHSSEQAVVGFVSVLAANDASHSHSAAEASLLQHHYLVAASAQHALSDVGARLILRGGGFVEGSTATRVAVTYTAVSTGAAVLGTVSAGPESVSGTIEVNNTEAA